MQWLASVLFTGLMFLSIPFYALAVVCVFWLPHRHRYRIAQAWARQVLWWLELLCGLSVVVEGRENIPTQASIAMIKHSSALEAIAELAIFPRQCWALKRELMWVPFFGWGVALLKPIAINRGGGRNTVNQLVQRGSQRLREGIWVMVFPEGTRVAAGETGRYGIGGGALAARSGALVVPVAHNAGDYWPRRGLLKRRGQVRMVIGQAITSKNREPREIVADVKHWVEATTAEIRASDPHSR